MNVIIGLLEHLGDIVACEPVTRYVRHKYPTATVSWAIREPYREIVDANPHVDKTLVLGCLTEWIRLCKHDKYDLIVDLHANYRICEDCRVSLVKRQGNPFINVYEYFDYGALLEAFSLGAGLPKLSAHPNVYIRDEDRTAVDALSLPKDFCVIHRQSNLAAKHWPEEKWTAFVRFVESDLKLPVVEIGSERANGAAPGSLPSIDLVGKANILASAEVIRRASLYVGLDSGPAHLANAVKTPGVILLGRIGLFRQYTPFTGFYASGSPEIRLVRNLMGPVADIEVEELIEAASYVLRALEDRKRRPAEEPNRAPLAPLSSLPANGHYRELVEKSGFFDPSWYVTQYPEVLESGLDPVEHFVTIGDANGYSPGPRFDGKWYKTQRPDLKHAARSFEHYLFFGRKEGLRRVPTNATSRVRKSSPSVQQIVSGMPSASIEVTSERDSQVDPASVPRLFAFYLPQFHPVAENNYEHRPGFTDWDNVIKAKPLFPGHYQPRIPGELGYYDLRSPEVLEEQVRLATQHGIDGFCFYYYYFQGKKLLYKPIRNYLQSDMRAPFLFLWANENWSRPWVGGDHEISASQVHSELDDLLFIRELIPTFSDSRYVKVDSKPVLLIYKPQLFPDIKRSVELWRNEIEKRGFPGIYLLMADIYSTSYPCRPRELGFDASYEIPSTLITQEMLAPQPEHVGPDEEFEGRIVDYRKFASFHMGRPFPEYKRFRTVMAPWDNTPRSGARATVHVNTDNEAYQRWLLQALIDTSRRYLPDERLVFLHSWNEWCEGTYVEPDGRYGRRLLEQTRDAVEISRRVISLHKDANGREESAVLLRLMHEKDEGAARSVQDMRQQMWHLYSDLNKQHEGIARLTREKSKNEEEVTELRQLSRKQETLISDLTKTNEDLTRTIDDSTRAKDDLEKTIGDLTKTIEDRTKTIEDLSKTIEDLTKTVEHQRGTLRSVFSSKSWRVTRPLRQFTNVVKKRSDVF